MGQYGTATGVAIWWNPDTNKGEVLSLLAGEAQAGLRGEGLFARAGQVAGFDIAEQRLSAGDAMVLDSAARRLTLGSSVFGNAGLQLDFNDGAARVYFGNGSDRYFRLDGELSWQGYNTQLSTAGVLSIGPLGGNRVVLDGSSGRAESSGFASGVSGWRIDGSGNAEFNDLRARGSIITAVFQKSLVTAFAGSQIVSKSASTLTTACTSASPSFTLKVAKQAGGAPFGSGDVVRLKADLGQAWVTVDTGSDQGTYWQYTATMQHGDLGVTFPVGHAVIDYGQAGDGYVFLTADDGSYDPYVSIAEHNGQPWQALTERVRLGRLSGISGQSGYGLWMNRGTIAMYSGVWDQDASGFRLTEEEIAGQYGGVDQVVLSATDGKLRAGAGDILLDKDGVTLRASATGYETTKVVKWLTAGGTLHGYGYAYSASQTAYLVLGAQKYDTTPGTGQVNLEALGKDGSGNYVSAELRLISPSAGGVSVLRINGLPWQMWSTSGTTIQAGLSAARALIVKAAAGQSNEILAVQDSSSNTLAAVKANGATYIKQSLGLGLASTPAFLLDVRPQESFTRTAVAWDQYVGASWCSTSGVSGGGVGLRLGMEYNHVGKAVGLAAVAEATYANDVGLGLYTSASGTLTERARLKAAGDLHLYNRLGVGVAPTEQVDIQSGASARVALRVRAAAAPSAAILRVENNTGTAVYLSTSKDGNLGIGTATDFGGGVGVIGIVGSQTAPSSNPASGGHVIFTESGALKSRGSSGTVTTIAAAEPHCPVCGTDFVLEWQNDQFGHLIVCVNCLAREFGSRAWIMKE